MKVNVKKYLLFVIMILQMHMSLLFMFKRVVWLKKISLCKQTRCLNYIKHVCLTYPLLDKNTSHLKSAL